MKQDHRVRLTKMLLRDSFLDLLADKPVAKVTVKELCEHAGMNRATFYAHYRDIFDLYGEMERELTRTVMQSLDASKAERSLSSFSLEICQIVAANERTCRAVFGEHGDPDFILRIVETLRESSMALWHDQYPHLSEDELDRFYTFMANGCLAIVRSWIQGGRVESVEDIASFIQKMTDSGLSGL